MMFKDINGKDAIATIDEENRKIMIEVDIYYSTNSRRRQINQGLNFNFLGSERATVNSSDDVVSAQDYACPPWRDAWGYLLQDRTYDSDDSKFKFTGKERDVESDYDYFGARYYDARIGRWGQTEPLLDKYPGFSPYMYSLANPLTFFDPNGNDVIAISNDAQQMIFPAVVGVALPPTTAAPPPSSVALYQQQIIYRLYFID